MESVSDKYMHLLFLSENALLNVGKIGASVFGRRDY